MDDHGSHRTPHRQSGMRVSTKSKAPSPPVRSPGLQSFPGYPHLTMDRKDTLVEEDVSLLVVLPGGVEQMTTVHGSKPLMDLLVMLCAKYHLNPSSHTLELVTANRNHIKFKPNALIGTLEAERVLLKPKGMEDKNKKTGPQMPEATVRMVINYKNSQKTILRVNPRVPLADLLPAICVKCEFDVETTVLLREIQSQGPLDLSNSLNDYAIREIYARDMKDQPASPVCPTSPTPSGLVTPGKDKNQKEKENKGLFSKFRRSKKQSEQATTASAPASPVLVSKPRPLSMALPSSSPFVSPTTPTDVPKKRRAPQPPMVVSQSCPSDLCIRQRLCSEPDATLDADQISWLSRGSSAESSLRRTKRKAPPPPVSPSTVVQDPLYLDEGSQGDAATNTLEEIKELEEISASCTSGAAGDTVGDDGSLNLSADISQDSPSQDTDKLSQASVEGTGGRWPGDLSAHGKSMASTVDKQAMHAPEVNSSEVEHSESTLHQVDKDGMQSACEGSAMASEAVVSPIPFPCETREAETQASVQASAEAPCEESLVVSRKPGPTGEDAQVQTDLTALPVPSQQHAGNVACLLTAPATGSLIQKRDMATFTEELCDSGLGPALETPSRQTSAPSASVITPAASTYAAGSEPKPKPSNELTRDYCPKVGMTTYTIVPQKSLEKLRYFEVELTLESPAVAPVKQKDIVSLELGDGASLRGQTVLTTSRENTPMSYSSASTHSTVDRRLMELAHSPSPLMEAVHFPSPTGLPAADENNLGFQTGSMADVKEMKIPPATKPKPGSFRMAQHKRTPGYYVTSAAVKSPHASPAAGQKEAPCSLERLPPPPLPPPVECLEEAVGGSNVELSPRSDDIKTVPILTPLTRQSSREPALGLSLDKLRSFAAPRPYSPATPSRFAQAVSSAVRRSQSVSHSPVSPRSPVSPPFSPIGGRFSVKRLAKPKESDNREVGADNAIRHENVPEPSPTRGDSSSPPQCLNECENKSLYCKKNEDPAICFSSSPAPVSPKI